MAWLVVAGMLHGNALDARLCKGNGEALRAGWRTAALESPYDASSVAPAHPLAPPSPPPAPSTLPLLAPR